MVHLILKLYLIVLIGFCEGRETPFRDYNLIRLPLIDWKQLSDDSAAKQAVHLRLDIFGNSYAVSLHRGQSVFTPDATVVVHREEEDTPQVMDAVDVQTEPVEGSVVGRPDSYVRGFIDDGVFNGIVSVGEEHYFVESADKYLKQSEEGETIVYRSVDVDNWRRPVDWNGLYPNNDSWVSDTKAYCNVNSHTNEDTVNHRTNDKEPNMFGPLADAARVGRVCKMKVVGDHWFMHDLSHNDINKAIKNMEFHMKEADAMYRVTDFDGNGRPDNIRIRVSRAEVFHNPRDRLYFLSHPTSNASFYLDMFSLYNHDGLCGAMAFSYRRFPDNVLGYAYRGAPNSPGGICNRRRMSGGKEKSLNVGMVSFMQQDGRVPLAQSAVLVSHELGHMFGSPHDEDTDNGACFHPREDKHYIMSSVSNPGVSVMNRRFSRCSIKKILTNLKANGGCLVCKGRECSASLRLHQHHTPALALMLISCLCIHRL